jgi:hypothetical protein
MSIIHEEGVILLPDNDFDRLPGPEEKRHSHVKPPNWWAAWRFREARPRQHAARILIERSGSGLQANLGT